MFHSHGFNGLCYSLRLVGIVFGWSAGGYCTEITTTRADISKNHKSGSAFTPAFAHVWAVAALANGVQLIVIDNLSYFSITFANWKFHSQPIWPFLSLTLCFFRLFSSNRSVYFLPSWRRAFLMSALNAIWIHFWLMLHFNRPAKVFKKNNTHKDRFGLNDQLILEHGLRRMNWPHSKLA